ncbi:TatD family hydrolase, partial [Candidatus Parcubacteria bacterium]|nr:TatD family hydrolase [Candidatus Parcubacteria bacterium]
MIDVHCHLEYMENPNEILKTAKEKGMLGLISSVAEPKDAQKILTLSEKWPNFLYVSLGFHPDSIENYNEKEILEYENFIEKNRGKIIAIGEIGLDYFHQLTEKEKIQQKKIFQRFLQLAQKLNLPVVLHCREAFEDLFSILKEEKTERVCLHCFSGSEGILKEAIKRGYFISFATNICYTKKHPRLAQKTPIEKLLLETDSPWLDPDSPKTLTNRPWKIEKSAKIIAQIKNLTPEKILEMSAKN